MNKCQHFEGTGRILCHLLVIRWRVTLRAYTMSVSGSIWLRIRSILMEGSIRCFAIVLTRYRARESQIYLIRWEIELCMGQTNQMMTNNKRRGKWLKVGVTRSVLCLLFNPVERFMSHHSVLFCLLVRHFNLLVLTFLSLL